MSFSLSGASNGSWSCGNGLCAQQGHTTGGGLTISFQPQSNSASSSWGGGSSGHVNSNNISNNIYVGQGGQHCSILAIQKATRAFNALNDTYAPANQILAALLVLFDEIDFSCTAENIQGLCSEIEKRLQPVIDKDVASVNKQYGPAGLSGKWWFSHNIPINKLAGILRWKGQTPPYQLNDVEGPLMKFLRKNDYPFPRPVMPGSTYLDVNGYNLDHVDSTGMYYLWQSVDPRPQSIPEGHVKWEDKGIKLDWSDEWTKITRAQSSPLMTMQRIHIYQGSCNSSSVQGDGGAENVNGNSKPPAKFVYYDNASGGAENVNN